MPNQEGKTTWVCVNLCFQSSIRWLMVLKRHVDVDSVRMTKEAESKENIAASVVIRHC